MTQLSVRYWRYIISIKGRNRARALFHTKLSTAEGSRRDTLVHIYLEVFGARA